MCTVSDVLDEKIMITRQLMFGMLALADHGALIHNMFQRILHC